MSKPLVIVTGKNGQLGWELQQVAAAMDVYDFLFVDSDELNLADLISIPVFFEKHSPTYFINCAAYTAVDKAETEQEQAYKINAEAVGIIAQQCRKYNCTLINISTDYVFNGQGTKPYSTGTKADPVNYYGYTKWLGEKLAIENNPQTIIIRTSWLYSSHGNNFVKTMLRLMNERTELNVVSDQTGSPTYAADLAETIMHIVSSARKGNKKYGIYQYSNSGVISWFDFANAIRELSGSSCKILPVPTSDYPTIAKRPAYSVMDTSAIVTDFAVTLKDWKKSLHECIAKIALK